MNIFLRELKAHRWGLLFWSLGMALLVMSGMAKYAAYEQAGQSVEQVMAALPKGVQTIFGMTGFDLTKASGFYGILFLYMAVMGAVHGVLLGSGLISKEERDRTSEFLYSKPVSRSRAITGKLSAGLANVIIFNLVTMVSSFYFVALYGGGESLDREILLLMSGLFFVQLIFFSLGAAVAATAHKPKRAPGRATTIMLVTFILYYVVNLNENLEFLKYLTPFKYFDAAGLMAKNRLDPVSIALSVAIIVVAILGTYRSYSDRDLSV
ncbi:ABC transporter permease [bacterium]|nr:ABC transporter permease [bacterium]